jgi:hypothetical protein
LASYTTTVETIIDSVIQDSQVQTTNRPTLLNYLNRVSQRILRESQWIFLQSLQQKFITKRGVTKYWIGPSPAPVDCIDTRLNIADLNSILPETVFDITNNRQLLQDAQSVLVQSNMQYLDGTYRESLPRTFRYDYNDVGVFHILPPPMNQNRYQPVPLPCGLSYTSGGASSTPTNYYVHTTLVDSLGGESIPANDFSHIVVPAKHLPVVHAPALSIEAATDVTYPYFNIYMSSSPHGTYTLQNAIPISRNNAWSPLEGLEPGVVGRTFVTLISPGGEMFNLTVNTDGSWLTTSIGYAGVSSSVLIPDIDGNSWAIQVANDGTLESVEVTNDYVNSLLLKDSNGLYWVFSANSDGSLETTECSVSSTPIPPPTYPTIEPIWGYVIAFHYQKKRKPLVLMTDVLQIPDEYVDVVYAGLNYYVNMYTSKDQDVAMKASIWKKEFMDGLAQMRRDLRINNRNADFLSPDRASQKNQGVDWNLALYN